MIINMTTKNLVKIAVVAALYAVLTSILAPISYGPVQFRISELMVFLAYFNPIYIIGLTLGCFITNILTSPYVILDGIFGTFGTLLSVVAIHYTGKVFKRNKIGLAVASIWPTIFNGIIVGWVVYTCGVMEGWSEKGTIALLGSMASVGIGEFVVVTIVGVPLVIFIMNKYKAVLGKI